MPNSQNNMFDQPTPPTNLPTSPADANLPAGRQVPFGSVAPASSVGRPTPEPEDMFGSVDKTPPPIPQSTPLEAVPASGGLPLTGQALTPPIETPAEIKQPLVSSRKVIVIGGVVLGVLIVAGVAYGVLKFVRQAAAPTYGPTVEVPTPTVVAPSPAPVVEPVPLPVPEPTPPPPPLDTDGDGLTDEEETALGTQANNPDSDTDGLFDNEEVKTYQTDPLNPDTDGDTYLDGQEVRAGYNPKGTGKLFTVPTQ